MQAKGWTMAARVRAALIALSIIGLANCGGAAPSTPSAPAIPSPSPLTGEWVGATTDSRVGMGSIIRVALSQSGDALAGTWESSFPTFSEDSDQTGLLNGTVNGSGVSVTLTLDGAPPVCSFAVTATLNASATEMLGTYAVVRCNIASTSGIATSGSITFTKQ